ncbi:MAG: putative dehydrogenase [Aeromicrobium sp.]|nr:putative dehydrogenase [Aeromicrobium sp.]
MTTPQQPIGSDFDTNSTVDDVLGGVDLAGKRALVTGGYSGIGLVTTQALAAAGAEVVVPARRPDLAREQVADIRGVEVDELDLGDLESVRTFADRFLASNRTLDLVINSAGIMAAPEKRIGDGWESQFATNHLGHFALINRLWPAIESGAGRVVSVSSRGHHFSGIRWDDVQFDHDYDKWLAYGQAKTANALFALHLNTLGSQAGVEAFSVHPGAIMTNLLRHISRDEQIESGTIDEAGNAINPRFKSPERGAATQVWAATSKQLEGLGGVYLEECEVAVPYVEGMEYSGVMDWATDPDQAGRLWDLSAELTGVNAFA